MKMHMTTKQLFMAVAALAGWFALLLQLYLTIYHPYFNKDLPVAARVGNYFSYFTILTNIIVALSFSVPLLRPATRAALFFSSPRTIAGIAMFISVVAVVYFLALRNLWNPEGAQLIANVILHYAIPFAYVVYWLAFVPKGSLVWKDAVAWLAFPAAYTSMVLLRGAAGGWYPYPFLDADGLGYPRVLTNMTALLMVFLAIGVSLVMIDRLMGRADRTARG